MSSGVTKDAFGFPISDDRPKRKRGHPTAKQAVWLTTLGDGIVKAVALLDECLNDEEAWDPEKLIERMEDVREVLTGRRNGL